MTRLWALGVPGNMRWLEHKSEKAGFGTIKGLTEQAVERPGGGRKRSRLLGAHSKKSSKIQPVGKR